MRPWILAGVLLGIFPSSAPGQDIEITPMAGYRFGGTLYSLTPVNSGAPIAALEVGDGAAFGVHVGYRIREYQIEALYARQETNLLTPGLFTSTPVMDLALETWQAGGNYLFGGDNAKVVPFIGFGLGFTRLLPKAHNLSDETRFSASFAGGAKLWLGAHVGIRVEGRYFLTVFDNNNDFNNGPCNPNSGCDGRGFNRYLSQGEARGGLILRF